MKDWKMVVRYAAQVSDVGVIKLLIEQGANVTARDDKGYTPLHLACIAEKAEIIKELIRAEISTIEQVDKGG